VRSGDIEPPLSSTLLSRKTPGYDLLSENVTPAGVTVGLLCANHHCTSRTRSPHR